MPGPTIAEAEADPRDAPPGAPEGDALAAFSVLWALAALWHLLGNYHYAPTWSQVLLAAGIGLVLWRPRHLGALSLLAGGGLVTAWEEAPAIGNHWLLAAFVNLALLLSVADVLVRRRRTGEGARGGRAAAVAGRFLPTARLCLLGFYAFAAFAKVNSAFFDRSVSCAVYYFRESTDSLGLSGLQLGGTPWLERAVIVGTVAIELSVPVLLAVRRTRHLGVVVALVFHALLALDRTHTFFDFSSVLSALFVLFLPAAFATGLVDRARRAGTLLATQGERVPALVHAGAALVPAGLALALAQRQLSPRTARLIGWWTWQVGVAALILAVVAYLLRHRPEATRAALRAPRALVAVLPLLVVLNGLTPYLEVKTGYGWNMYANLTTVDGDSNHYVVRRTLPLTDEQDDIVRIVATDDEDLALYAERDFGLTWRQLRTYLAKHPDVAITFERGDETVALDHASDLPALVEPVPDWREKVQLFRAVDLRSPARCVPAFGAAR